MEAEAREALAMKPPVITNVSVDSLIQGCSSLLQAIESAASLGGGQSTKLPANVLDAMRLVHTSVEQMRPLPPPSKDAPLEPEQLPFVPAILIEGDSIMEEMDDTNLSDENLLEIAKRLRAKRLRVA